MVEPTSFAFLPHARFLQLPFSADDWRRSIEPLNKLSCRFTTRNRRPLAPPLLRQRPCPPPSACIVHQCDLVLVISDGHDVII
jgi:hypothetical protein